MFLMNFFVMNFLRKSIKKMHYYITITVYDITEAKHFVVEEAAVLCSQM
jgi:hypothetical protein